MTSFIHQSFRFVMVGAINTTVGLGIIYLLMFFLKTEAIIANAAGYAIGLVVSFFLNKKWTFNNNRSISHVLPKYALAALACYCLNLFSVITATSHFSVNPYLAQLIGVGSYTISMFLGCRYFVFSSAKAY